MEREECQYTVLNPSGHYPAFEKTPLTAARLDSLNGKTIYLIEFQNSLKNYGIPEALKRAYPDAEVVLWDIGGVLWAHALAHFPPPEVMAKVDATICGIGW